MRSRPLAVVLLVIALVLPRLFHPHHVYGNRASMAASSAAWGRHRKPPAWLKRPCAGRGCTDIAVLDSSGLCVVCNPVPWHPGHLAALKLDPSLWDNEAWQQAIT